MKTGLHSILLQPLLTEKITAMREANNTVGFLVHPDANRVQIKQAVEALLKVKANDYDAVICDVMMPRLRGDEFYLQARDLRPPLADRFIFITGFAADPKINKFLTTGDVKYLVKPFPVQQLIDCLRQLLS